ncbi:peptidase [Psychromonas ingrahamii 37]|uniref:Peptidase n=1 Tax=Psychromonas ingrahamii (strain DSM 17664 / CCUG 51855 / 37) TaxID=357804 RepID=A1SY36_PSYIN|nr:peptidase [Psychromonas ingrahamii]ABM04401.1 peptidase [Psychromonas ingrahamii 37]
MENYNKKETPAYIICSTAEFITLTVNSSIEIPFTRVVIDNYQSSEDLKGAIEARLNLSFSLIDSKDCILLFCNDLDVKSITKINIFNVDKAYCLDEDSKHFYQTVINPQLHSQVFLPLINCELIAQEKSISNLKTNILKEFHFSPCNIDEIKELNVKNNIKLRNVIDFKRECRIFGDSDFSFLADIFTIAVLIKISTESNQNNKDESKAPNYKKYKGGYNFLPKEHLLMIYQESVEASFLAEFRKNELLSKLNEGLRFSNQDNFSFVSFAYIYLKAKSYFMKSNQALKDIKNFHHSLKENAICDNEADQAIYLLLCEVGYQSLCDDLYIETPPPIYVGNDIESPSLKIKKLSKQLDQAQSDKAGVESQLEQAKNDKTVVESQLKQAQSDKARVESQLEQAKNDKTVVERQLEQAQNDKAIVERQLEQAQSDKAIVERQLEQSQSDNDGVERQLEQAKNDKTVVERQLEQAQSDKTVVESQLEQAQSDKNEAASQLEQAQSYKARFERQLEQVQSDKAGVESQLEQAIKDENEFKRIDPVIKSANDDKSKHKWSEDEFRKDYICISKKDLINAYPVTTLNGIAKKETTNITQRNFLDKLIENKKQLKA